MSQAPLYSPAVVQDLLNKYQLRADKAFGQNFLIDGNILAAIVSAAQISPTDTVLEIGPGLGVLTRELAKTAGRVISVELDARLLPVLNETTKDHPNVSIVHADGLEFDFGSLPAGSLLVANLPYNVATPLIVKALESGRFSRLVFLVQREVAERLSARAGDSGFGALSLLVEYFGVARKVRDVKPAAFFPAPDVVSSVVRIDVHDDVVADEALFTLIHTAFRHRRKTLKKNLLMSGYDRDVVTDALQQLELDERVRAEVVSLQHFCELKDMLATHNMQN